MFEAVPRFLNFQKTNAVFGCNLQVWEGKRKKKENGKRKDRKCFSHACLIPRTEGEKKRMEYTELFFLFLGCK